MKRILTNFILICLVALIAVGCGKKQKPMDLYDLIQQRGHWVVGVEADIEPFCFKDKNGNYDGYEIELVKKIAKNILNDENAIEFVDVTPSNRISMLNSGQADLIVATMTINPQRLEIIDFSEPYYIAGQTVLVKKSSKITSLSDLKNKRVGTIFGTTANEGIKSVAPTSLISGFKSYNDAIRALKTNQIDGIALDDTILMGFAMKDNSLFLINKKYTQEPYGVAFRKGTESTRVLDAVNDVLHVMKSNGDLGRLQTKWLR